MAEFKVGDRFLLPDGDDGRLIGMDSNGDIQKQSDWGNFMRYPIDHIASDKEIDILMRKIMDAKHITNY